MRVRVLQLPVQVALLTCGGVKGDPRAGVGLRGIRGLLGALLLRLLLGLFYEAVNVRLGALRTLLPVLLRGLCLRTPLRADGEHVAEVNRTRLRGAVSSLSAAIAEPLTTGKAGNGILCGRRTYAFNHFASLTRSYRTGYQ